MTSKIEGRSKFNFALLSRMVQTCKPFWTAFGANQKWLFLSFVLVAAYPMSLFYSFGSTWVSSTIKTKTPEVIPFVAQDLDAVGMPFATFVAFGLGVLAMLIPVVRRQLSARFSETAYKIAFGAVFAVMAWKFYEFVGAYNIWVASDSASAAMFHRYMKMLGWACAWSALPAVYLTVLRRYNIIKGGWFWLCQVTVFLVVVAGINAFLSFIQNGMFTFLQHQKPLHFWVQFSLLVCIFITGILIIPYYHWVRETLGKEWRQWMTEDILSRWMADRKYLEIGMTGSVENPDQRVTEDPRGFTQEALGMLITIMDSVLELIIYAAILFAISQALGYALFSYAVIGSVISIWIGKVLIGGNYNQEACEAHFRYQAVYVRESAEAIAFLRGEKMELRALLVTLGRAISNFEFLLRWQRNLAFFTKGYQFMVIGLPMFILAPLYFAKSIELGDLMQGMNAFSHVMAALSLLVSRFPAITKFAANCNRLVEFLEELKKPAPCSTSQRPRIERRTGEVVNIDNLDVFTPDYSRLLLDNLSVKVAKGDSLVIMGPSGSGKSTILRGIAGLISSGHGSVTMPDITETMFLPQKPYLPLGSLRWQLTYPNPDLKISDEELRKVLELVNLPGLDEKFAQYGGFEAELAWQNTLSLGEQQRVALARLLLSGAKWVFLDEASSALDAENEARLYKILKQRGVTLVSVGHRPSLKEHHSRLLELDGKGGYSLIDTAVKA